MASLLAKTIVNVIAVIWSARIAEGFRFRNQLDRCSGGVDDETVCQYDHMKRMYWFSMADKHCYPVRARYCWGHETQSRRLFETLESCERTCKPPHVHGCAPGSGSSGYCDKQTKCERPGTECKMRKRSAIGDCCNAKIEASFRFDNQPRCHDGSVKFIQRVDYWGEQHDVLFGLICDHDFCPIRNYKCVKGVRLSYCCKTEGNCPKDIWNSDWCFKFRDYCYEKGSSEEWSVKGMCKGTCGKELGTCDAH